MTVVGFTEEAMALEKYLDEIVGKRIPEEDQNKLDRMDIVFVLPDMMTSFMDTRYFYQRSKEISDPIPVQMIVLSPGYLSRTRDEIIYTLAHELAHVFLGHDSFLSEQANVYEKETSTDRQVIDWGFEKELRACDYNYLFGRGFESINKV